jgi:hypothetical protein
MRPLVSRSQLVQRFARLALVEVLSCLALVAFDSFGALAVVVFPVV